MFAGMRNLIVGGESLSAQAFERAGSSMSRIDLWSAYGAYREYDVLHVLSH